MRTPTRRTRLPAIARWIGAVVCGVLLVAWVVSPFYWCSYYDGRGTQVRLDAGTFGVISTEFEQYKLYAAAAHAALAPARFHSGTNQKPRMRWWVGTIDTLAFPMQSAITPAQRFIWIPLWMPLVLAALPTGVLWWRELRRRRRPGAGACGGCGYDRAGIDAAAVCPECGREPTIARGT